MVVVYGTVAAGQDSFFVASLAMNTQGNLGDFILSNLRGLKLARGENHCHYHISQFRSAQIETKRLPSAEKQSLMENGFSIRAICSCARLYMFLTTTESDIIVHLSLSLSYSLCIHISLSKTVYFSLFCIYSKRFYSLHSILCISSSSSVVKATEDNCGIL